jgi:hypothetical protein
MINLEKAETKAQSQGSKPIKPPRPIFDFKLIAMIAIGCLAVIGLYFGVLFVKPSTPPGQGGGTSPSAAMTGELVRAQIAKFVQSSEAGSIDEIIQAYAPRVDYFGHGEVDRSYIRQDIDQFRKRWPIHREGIVGNIEVSAEGSDWSADYRSTFYVENTPGNEWVKGEAQVRCKLGIVDGRPKISYIRAEITERERGDSSSRP